MIPSSRTRLAAAFAAAAFAVNASIQLTSPRFDPHISGARDWANEVTFTIAVAAALVAVLGLARDAVLARRPARVAAAGFALLLVGLLPEYATSESPEWFAVVGAPGNLLCLIGLGWAAKEARDGGVAPRAVVPLMPLSVLVGVGAAEFGGGLVAAAWWVCAATIVTRAPAVGAVQSGVTATGRATARP